MKTSMIIVLTIFTISVANAGPVENKIQSINTWFENEKSETINFQKVKWQEGKAQIDNTKVYSAKNKPKKNEIYATCGVMDNVIRKKIFNEEIIKNTKNSKIQNLYEITNKIS